jgi:hypothetical protein
MRLETTAGLNLRAAPSEHAVVLRVLPIGTQVDERIREGAWSLVRTESGTPQQGWASISFLRRPADSYAPTVHGLGDFLAARGARHFEPVEPGGGLCPVGRPAMKNGKPVLGRDGKPVLLQLAPQKLWARAAQLVAVLEWIRLEVGKPVRVGSGYRDPLYNLAIDGAKQSQHLNFAAADISVAGMRQDALHAVIRKHPRFGQLWTKVYEGFVHVDVRGFP